MTKMRTKTYYQLMKEVKSYDNIKVPNELRHPPSLSYQYERSLEKVIAKVDSINDGHGDREVQMQAFAQSALQLIAELIDGGISTRLKTQHILRVKDAKIASQDARLNPKPKKKGKGGSDEDMSALKDILGS